MRGSPRMSARGGRSGGRERAAAGRGGWNWIWGRVGSAELGNGFEQLAPVAYRRHPDVLEIIGRQLRQHFPIDFVIAEVGLVSLETHSAQPGRYVHRRLPFNPTLSSPAVGQNPIRRGSDGRPAAGRSNDNRSAMSARSSSGSLAHARSFEPFGRPGRQTERGRAVLVIG